MSPGCTCRKAERRWSTDGECSTCGNTVLEKQIAPVVLKILCAGTGLTLWRNPAGFDEARKVRYGLDVGSADYVGIWTPRRGCRPGSGRYVEVELKTPKGRLSDEQRARRDFVHGELCGVYAVVRSEDTARVLLSYLRSIA